MVIRISTTMPPKGPVLFKFGLISDIQHADIPDGYNFSKTSKRYYRQALIATERAVQDFEKANVDFCIHLGDIIDYHNSLQPKSPRGITPSASEKALQDVLDQFEKLEKKQVATLHCLGNHCLYNMSREILNERLGIHHLTDGQPHSYYSYSPHPLYKLIFIDGYDVSFLGWPPGHPRHEEAVKILNQHNPNDDKNSPNGLHGFNRRFVKFGGGLSDTQLQWLDQELSSAKEAGQKVIIASHLCIHPNTCSPVCLLWNYDKVLALIRRWRGVVVATLAGHAHLDGEYMEEEEEEGGGGGGGVYHRVCRAVLETEPGRDAWAVVSVGEEYIDIKGYDTFASAYILYNK